MKFSVKNGSFSYGTHHIIQDISFSVESGRILAILGPNGAGKTTLLRCMMGLTRWDTGASYLDGADIRTLPAHTLWQKVAYVPQARNSTMLYKAEDMVLLGRGAHLGTLQQPGEKDRAIAKKAMEIVGISHLQGKLCSKMSGGELQMVLIARALAAQPQMLVLDEPESNLDFRNQLIILKTLRELADTQGLSFVFNTHYPAHALSYADDVLLLEKNDQYHWGKSSQVMTEALLERTFGVRTHIGHFTVDGVDYVDVIPLSVTEDTLLEKEN